jgi:hypothetical protein
MILTLKVFIEGHVACIRDAQLLTIEVSHYTSSVPIMPMQMFALQWSDPAWAPRFGIGPIKFKDIYLN